MIKNLIAGILICLCLVACEEPDLVSSDVIPGTDQPGVFTDTIEVTAFTVADQPMESDNRSLPMLIGTINDQEIGSTTASLYIQMLLGASSPSIPSNAVLTSMVVSLAYQKIHGDSTARHTFSVYQLADSLSSETDYYTTDTFNVVDAFNPLGSATFVPALINNGIDGSIQASRMEVKLNNSFSQDFFAYMKDSSSIFATNAALLKYFKGMYIKSTTDFIGSGDVKGSIIEFNSSSTVNTVTVKYSYLDTVIKYSSYSFQLGANSVRSTHVKHTYNPGIINDSLQTPASLYLQSLSGLRIKVRFPGLAALQGDGSLSINKAELIVKVKSNTINVIPPYPQLATTEEDNTLIQDYNDDEQFATGKIEGDTYRLILSQQLQRIVNGSVSDFIYIETVDRLTNARRTILEGAGSIKLNLTYTKNN